MMMRMMMMSMMMFFVAEDGAEKRVEGLEDVAVFGNHQVFW